MSDGEHWLRCARHAWQQLGNMNPEVAMEQYIKLLSDTIPEWIGEKPDVSNLLISLGTVFLLCGSFLHCWVESDILFDVILIIGK